MAIFSLSERLDRFCVLSEESKKHLDGTNSFQRTYDPRSEIFRAGEPIASLPLVQSGWLATFDVTPEGKRGILELALPGDILSGPMHGRAPISYTVTALTSATVSFHPTAPIIDAMRTDAGMATAFLRLETYQHERLQDRLLPLTQLRSYERTAHLFLDLHARLDAVGMTANGRFRMPLNQAAIADHLGMHEVHVNRVLRQMDHDGYVLREKGYYITILDHAALAAMTGFRDHPRPARHTGREQPA